MTYVEDVRCLYERYPCQSPQVSDDLIHDLALGVSLFVKTKTLAGWSVLDAGCGTGHRLLGLAARYPRAQFTGLDMSEASLRVARALASRHGLSNVRFVHGYIGHADVGGPFDLITSTGVVHCLDDPPAGLDWLVRRLSDNGLVYLWHYHRFGEHQRMLEWELARLLSRGDTGPDGLSVVRALGVRLTAERYGTRSAHIGSADGADQDAIDVDAYLHPIVRAYRFEEACQLFDGLDVAWVAINGVNWEGGGKLVDLASCHTQSPICITDEDLFTDEDLRCRYRKLSARDKSLVIELRLKPTGLTVVAGRNDSINLCHSRIVGNILIQRPQRFSNPPTAQLPS